MTEFNGSLYYIASEEETSSELKREVLEGKKHEALAAAQPPRQLVTSKSWIKLHQPKSWKGIPSLLNQNLQKLSDWKTSMEQSRLEQLNIASFEITLDNWHQ